MTCHEMVDFLSEYVEGRLDDAERKLFEDHLDLCPPCIAYLDSFRTTITLSKSLCADGDAIPDDVPEDLIEAILEVRRAR